MRARAFILARKKQTGEHLGFVKSVSYTKRTYKLTPFTEEAKGYASDDAVQKDLNMLNWVDPDNVYFQIVHPY